jgi:hypothetical protein
MKKLFLLLVATAVVSTTTGWARTTSVQNNSKNPVQVNIQYSWAVPFCSEDLVGLNPGQRKDIEQGWCLPKTVGIYHTDENGQNPRWEYIEHTTDKPSKNFVSNGLNIVIDNGRASVTNKN